MFKTVSPGAIGVRTRNLSELCTAAAKTGFGGVEFSIHEVADLIDQQGAEAVRAIFAGAGVKPGGWSLPDGWRTTDEKWRRDLEALPRLAKAGAALGSPRTFTYILPCSDEKPFEENYRFHVERFTPIARILAEHGCHLGLEFIGPKTLRAGKRHPFIHTMEEMLAMGREIGPNVGLLLDCWHWYTSHSTLAALKALQPKEVVYVHVNDAPRGIPIDEQIDSKRELPGETGVIDIAGFLGTLREIGYDGPVTPEPFKKELQDLPSDEARLTTVAGAMDRIFRTAGL